MKKVLNSNLKLNGRVAKGCLDCYLSTRTPLSMKMTQRAANQKGNIFEILDTQKHAFSKLIFNDIFTNVSFEIEGACV